MVSLHRIECAPLFDEAARLVDVWVAAHGSQYGLHDKYEAGEEYRPETFVDPDGFLAAVERLEKLYLDQVADEGH